MLGHRTVPRRRRRAIELDGHALRWWYRLPYCRCADCPQDWPHVVIADASRSRSVPRRLRVVRAAAVGGAQRPTTIGVIGVEL